MTAIVSLMENDFSITHNGWLYFFGLSFPLRTTLGLEHFLNDDECLEQFYFKTITTSTPSPQ